MSVSIAHRHATCRRSATLATFLAISLSFPAIVGAEISVVIPPEMVVLPGGQLVVPVIATGFVESDSIVAFNIAIETPAFAHFSSMSAGSLIPTGDGSTNPEGSLANYVGAGYVNFGYSGIRKYIVGGGVLLRVTFTIDQAASPGTTGSFLVRPIKDGHTNKPVFEGTYLGRTVVRNPANASGVVTVAGSVSGIARVTVPENTVFNLGDAVRIPVRLEGLDPSQDVRAAHVRILYPADILDYVGTEAGTALPGGETVNTPSSGVIDIAWTSTGQAVSGTGVLWNLDFVSRTDAGYGAAGEVIVGRIDGGPVLGDGASTVLVGTNAGAVRSGRLARVSVPATASYRTGTKFTVPVTVADLDAEYAANGVSLRVSYPADLLAYSKATIPTNSPMKGGTRTINAATPGIVTLTCTGTTSVLKGNGTLLNVEFTMLGDTASYDSRRIELEKIGGNPVFAGATLTQATLLSGGEIRTPYPVATVSVPSDTTFAAGETVVLPVRVEDLDSWYRVRKSSLVITYPGDILTYDAGNILAGTLPLQSAFHETATSPGTIFLTVSDTTKYLHGAGVLLYVRFGVRLDVADGAMGAVTIAPAAGVPVFRGDIRNPGVALASGIVRVPIHVAMSEDNGAPAEIFRAWPNPFNAETAIELGAPAGPGGPWEGAIYDVSGRIVRRWRMEAPGIWRWDARDEAGRPLGGGVYVAVVRYGERRMVTRVTLVR